MRLKENIQLVSVSLLYLSLLLFICTSSSPRPPQQDLAVSSAIQQVLPVVFIYIYIFIEIYRIGCVVMRSVLPPWITSCISSISISVALGAVRPLDAPLSPRHPCCDLIGWLILPCQGGEWLSGASIAEKPIVSCGYVQQPPDTRCGGWDKHTCVCEYRDKWASFLCSLKRFLFLNKGNHSAFSGKCDQNQRFLSLNRHKTQSLPAESNLQN